MTAAFREIARIAIMDDIYGPPGLTHPRLFEKYAWVDKRLEELYYGYALTADNCDEFQDAGLLTEKWAWVDARLREKYYENTVTSEFDEFKSRGILCRAPLAWASYREPAGFSQHSLEEPQESVLGKRKRAESDISDHEEEIAIVMNRLGCQSPLPSSKYIYL